MNGGAVRQRTSIRPVASLPGSTSVRSVRAVPSVRSVTAAALSSALLLLGVIAGFAGVGPGVTGVQTAGPSSSSSTPSVATVGPRSIALVTDRRQGAALTATGSARSAPGSSPTDPPSGDLVGTGWRSSAHLIQTSISGETNDVTGAVPSTQRSRAPPAGTAPV
jgi:hypothetical protein